MERKQALIQSEELYRAVVEICPDGIVVMDLDGTILAANRAAAQLHGYEHGEELIGVNLLDAVSPADRNNMKRTITNVLALGEVRHVEHRLLRRDVSFPADVNLSVMRDSDGRPLMVVAVVRDMTEHRQLEADLRYQALHDSLTDLPNRALLYDLVEQTLEAARPSGSEVCLLLLDLDGFKEVNDRYGHDFGDGLLEQVARRLQGIRQEAETVARLGGDEFAILVDADTATALQLAERVRDVLEPPVYLGHIAVQIGASIGIARYPVDGQDRRALLRCADMALYAAKRDRRNYMVYAPELGRVLASS